MKISDIIDPAVVFVPFAVLAVFVYFWFAEGNPLYFRTDSFAQRVANSHSCYPVSCHAWEGTPSRDFPHSIDTRLFDQR